MRILCYDLTNLKNSSNQGLTCLKKCYTGWRNSLDIPVNEILVFL
jgi:hypothetical protein